MQLPEELRALHEETFRLIGGKTITFGGKDGHVTYPEFGLNDIPDSDDEEGSRNTKHDLIMQWLNSDAVFNSYYEQVILSRLFYLHNYGIVYPSREHYSHMNAVLIHDKETTMKYSKRWAFCERFADLNVREYLGYSLDDFLAKPPYETDKLFEICERKAKRANSQMVNLKNKIEDMP